MRWKTLKGIVLVGTGLVLLLGCLNIVFRPFEPHYDGMPLRHWVYRTGEPGGFYFHGKTEDALKSMAPEAVPWLIRWLETADVPMIDPLIEAGGRRFNLDLWYFAVTGSRRRCSALWALELIGEPMTNAVPHIIARLKDGDSRVRQGAAEALKAFPSQFDLAVPALIKALGDPDERVVGDAAYSLKWFGTNAGPALPTLASLSSHHEPAVRTVAAKVLEFLRTNSPPTSGTMPLAVPSKK